MSYLDGPSIVPRPAAGREVQKFNDMFPVGTKVRYWAYEREGLPTGTAKTTTEAYVFGDIVAVVSLEGVKEPMPLSHLEVLP